MHPGVFGVVSRGGSPLIHDATGASVDGACSPPGVIVAPGVWEMGDGGGGWGEGQRR